MITFINSQFTHSNIDKNPIFKQCTSDLLLAAAMCKAWALRKPRNGRFEQSTITDENNKAIGSHIKMYCNNGYVFYDQTQPLVYECRNGEEFTNDNLDTYVPDCVGKQLIFNY